MDPLQQGGEILDWILDITITQSNNPLETLYKCVAVNRTFKKSISSMFCMVDYTNRPRVLESIVVPLFQEEPDVKRRKLDSFTKSKYYIIDFSDQPDQDISLQAHRLRHILHLVPDSSAIVVENSSAMTLATKVLRRHFKNKYLLDRADVLALKKKILWHYILSEVNIKDPIPVEYFPDNVHLIGQNTYYREPAGDTTKFDGPGIHIWPYTDLDRISAPGIDAIDFLLDRFDPLMVSFAPSVVRHSFLPKVVVLSLSFPDFSSVDLPDFESTFHNMIPPAVKTMHLYSPTGYKDVGVLKAENVEKLYIKGYTENSDDIVLDFTKLQFPKLRKLIVKEP